jgi:hypothetical protein
VGRHLERRIGLGWGFCARYCRQDNNYSQQTEDKNPMIDGRQCKTAVNLMAMVGILGAAMILSAQVSQSKSDADQIISLMAGLSDHSKVPTDVLDPSLSPSDRDKNLKRFGALHYELSLVPTESVQAITGDSASVPIRVHFNAVNGNQLDTNATAQFVRRNGTWYFSNFDFMGWPTSLIGSLVLGVLVAIAYAATVLILRSRLVKQGPLGINIVKMFIPFFWPDLFRQTR